MNSSFHIRVTPRRASAITLALLPLLAPHPARAAGGRLTGAGTSGSPFLIEDYADLEAVADSGMGRTYRLTADIDASASLHEHGDSGFVPIGTQATPFSGAFHGGAHTIRNLSIRRPSTAEVGLFGRLGDSARVDSLSVLDATISGLEGVAAIAGRSFGSVVSCRSSGTVVATGAAGGIVGLNYGQLRHSSSSSRISTSGGFAGGIAGAHYHDTILDCHASGSVSGSADVGGLVGYNSAAVLHSSATGAISGKERLGGLAGQNYLFGGIQCSWATGAVVGTGLSVGGFVGYIDYAGSIADCFATGAVTGNGDVGGFAGFVEEGRLLRCYATGKVTSNGLGDGDGGLVGYGYAATASIIDCRWNATSTSLASAAGSYAGTIASTRSLTGEEMLHAANFANWDFSASGPWSIDEGVSMPVLRPARGPVPGPVGIAPSRPGASPLRAHLRGDVLAFSLPRSGHAAVTVRGCDGALLGRLSQGLLEAGSHETGVGAALPARSGILLVSLELDGTVIGTFATIRR